MASNPFGITQVDVPALLGIVEQQRRSGIESMLMAKREAREDARAKRDEETYQRADDVRALFANPGKLPTPEEVMAVDPKAGAEWRTTYEQMGEQDRKKAAARVDALARASMSIRKLPYAQRRAALEQQADTLSSLTGLPRDQLMAFDPTDQAIDGIISQSMTVADHMAEIGRQRDDERQDRANADAAAYRRTMARQGEDRLTIAREAAERKGGGSTSPGDVIGPILGKVARGEPLTAGEAKVLNWQRQSGRKAPVFTGTDPAPAATSTVPNPFTPSAPAAPRPAAPAAARPPAKAVTYEKTATNPKTGQQMGWDGRQWVAISK